MIRVSTKIKAACGYVLLTLLLFFSIQYIYRKMQILTRENSFEQQLARQRRVTNQIILDLYQAEIISHAFTAGQLQLFDRYNGLINEAYICIDSLRSMVNDRKQQARLDTIHLLLQKKELNVRSLLNTLKKNSTDKVYQRYIEKLEQEQKIIVQKQPVIKTQITQSNVYTIRKKPKKLFKRIAEIFAPEKGDTIRMERIIQKETTDTIRKESNPSDSVAQILKDVQSGVSISRKRSIRKVLQSTNKVRSNGIQISQQINKILTNIDRNEQLLSEGKISRQNEIRRNAIRNMTIFSIAAVLLAALFLILVWRDITRSNHYRRELEKSKRYAENLLDTREKLMLTITHDIKAPAGTILGYIELLARIINDGRQKFYLGNMKSATQHLLNLIKSLLDYYRLESNKMEINMVVFNSSQLFNEIYLSFRPLAESKGLTLEYKSQVDASCLYSGDPFRIRQIAENLLSNSVKFTQKGSIKLVVAERDNQFVFSISDTGCGISEDEKKHIFEEFTRLPNAQGQEGFGLGLSIVLKLVQLLDGHITIESTPQEGSTFSVSLPLKLVTNTTKKEQLLSHCNILLVDDDPIQLQLTTAMLQHTGAEIQCCNNAEELMEALINPTFNLLLTDIQMPAMSGFDIIGMIRQLQAPYNRIPVIAVTARSDMRKDYLCSKGFANCLHKPFDSIELLQIIADTLKLEAQLPTEEKPMQEQGKGYYFSALTAFSDDDPSEAVTIMNTFISEMEKDYNSMTQAADSNNIKTMAALAHKMLPRFKIIGATHCQSILLPLEKEEIHEMTDELKKKIIALGEEMSEIIKEASNFRDTFVKRS